MSFLEAAQVEELLTAIRELGLIHKFVDLHVHGTEIIFDEIVYKRAAEGVYSTNDCDYQPPVPGRIRLDIPEIKVEQSVLNQVSKLGLTKAYQHTGPRIIKDQMAVAGLSQAVLLPVARAGLNFERQWSMLRDFSAGSSQLLLGYCLPESVAIGDIGEHLRGICQDQEVAVLKVHPNLSGIDIGSGNGVERVEAILDACGDLGLPCLVHGGCSPILHGKPESEFAVLSHLNQIDWSLTKSPVVVAHFGAYGCQASDINDACVAQLHSLLSRHENVYTDTSGVAYPVVKKMLGCVDHSRIVFGSDALYQPMWQAMVQLAFAALELFGEFEESLVRIAAHNTAKVLNMPAT